MHPYPLGLRIKHKLSAGGDFACSAGRSTNVSIPGGMGRQLDASPAVRPPHLQRPVQQAASHALVIGLAPQEDCSAQAAPHEGRRPPGIAGQGAAQDGSCGEQVVHQLLQAHCLQAEQCVGWLQTHCLQAKQCVACLQTQCLQAEHQNVGWKLLICKPLCESRVLL